MALKISEKYKIQIVQGNASTSSHSDNETESLYECLKQTYEEGRDSFYKVIIDDLMPTLEHKRKVMQLFENMESRKELQRQEIE